MKVLMLPDQESPDGSIPVVPTKSGQAYPPNWPKFNPPDLSLRGRRKALKLTQGELAAKFGVSVSTVQRWESGEMKPDAEGMLELALRHLEGLPYRACRARYEGFQYIGPDDEARRLSARLAEKPVEYPRKNEECVTEDRGPVLGHCSKCGEPFHERVNGW